MEHASLEDAVRRHVHPGDTVHVVLGHHRWTAAARELARQMWGTDPSLTLVMASLSSLGVLFFRGGLVRRVVTAYSGDSFPTYTPNPVYQQAYASGEVAVEHWSFLSLIQRLDAAARGLPAAVTNSLVGSDMAVHLTRADTPNGPVHLLPPLAPDVALLHAAVADQAGNVLVAPPSLEGVAGAMAARRGAIVTVERVVDDLRPYAHLVRIPAHRVLAVVEAPFGAHPGGVYAPGLPVTGYGEDLAFWVAARDAARGDVDAFCAEWCRDVATQEAYVAKLGTDRVAALLQRADPESWRADEAAHPFDEGAAVTAWETAAALAAREVASRVVALDAHAVLAGAGVANLAAWVGVAQARAQGHGVQLTAELGLWGYTPTPADPMIFNLRAFPSATMLSDATTVLGVLAGGPGTRLLACVGTAQVDATGNLNSTALADGTVLVGSGGGNDVVSTADEALVVTQLRPVRTPERVAYITAPGDRVTTVVTDLGILRKYDGRLRLAAVPAGAGAVDERIRLAVAACGWPLEVLPEVAELAEVGPAEVHALRRHDPQGFFLRG